MSRKLIYLLSLTAGALILAAIVLWLPQAAAQAQCGSQASSCKNCHEVQGKKPVNNDGTNWHQKHAFGDFCANCHGGNVQATDETAAHTGMIAPLSDIKANCAACHPEDTEAKAQEYAAILGVQLGSGGQAAGGAAATPAAGSPTPAPTPTNAPAGNNQLVSGLVDYNQQYAQSVQGQIAINWGNAIAGALIVVLAVGGGAFVFYNERRLRAARAPKPIAPAAAKAPTPPAAVAASPELGELAVQLQKLDPPAQRALRRLLTDPAVASELLVSLSRIDPRLIEAVRQLDRRELNLLMALAEEH